MRFKQYQYCEKLDTYVRTFRFLYSLRPMLSDNIIYTG
uniref:Uncharacterized protein n=1 Tax=Parascaris equorum TaxID=6256 RepID=A0A914RUT9_PAREQ